MHTTVGDPWEVASSFLISHRRFGTGSTRPFSWYFEGESQVPVASIEEICQWLAACQYVRDPDLFREPDYWQHPLTFEQLQKGDCEDHALWAWRKLTELGITAHFYVGQWLQGTDSAGHHAWVVFEQGGGEFLLESVTKDSQQIVMPLAQIQKEYIPHYSVDPEYKMSARTGLLLYWRQLELERRAKKKERGLTTA